MSIEKLESYIIKQNFKAQLEAFGYKEVGKEWKVVKETARRILVRKDSYSPRVVQSALRSFTKYSKLCTNFDQRLRE